MVIRNCSQLLSELTEIDNKIAKLENELNQNSPELDLENLLQNTFDKYLKKTNS